MPRGESRNLGKVFWPIFFLYIEFPTGPSEEGVVSSEVSSAVFTSFSAAVSPLVVAAAEAVAAAAGPLVAVAALSATPFCISALGFFHHSSLGSGTVTYLVNGRIVRHL